MSNLIKYQFVDLHPSDTVKINNNDKKDNFIPLGKDGGISIETIGQQEAEKAILSLQKKENNEAEPENISEEEYEKTKEEAELLEVEENEVMLYMKDICVDANGTPIHSCKSIINPRRYEIIINTMPNKG